MLHSNFCIGVDLGGTNISAGLVDIDSRKIVNQKSVKTKAPRSCEEICRDIAALCEDLCKMQGIKMKNVRWIGSVAPGIVKGDTVVFAANLGWSNVPYRKLLATATRRPTFIANDANAAAYAEAVWGSGSGSDSLVAFTIGTGVGGGIVIDKKIWEGMNGFAAELGHMRIYNGGNQCGCGMCGCLEAYCSATALVKETKRVMSLNPDSLLWKICEGDINRVNGKTVFLGLEFILCY